MCYDNNAKAAMAQTRLAGIASPPTDQDNINISRAKNGFLVNHSGVRNGECFNDVYVGQQISDVTHLVAAALTK